MRLYPNDDNQSIPRMCCKVTLKVQRRRDSGIRCDTVAPEDAVDQGSNSMKHPRFGLVVAAAGHTAAVRRCDERLYRSLAALDAADPLHSPLAGTVGQSNPVAALGSAVHSSYLCAAAEHAQMDLRMSQTSHGFGLADTADQDHTVTLAEGCTGPTAADLGSHRRTMRLWIRRHRSAFASHRSLALVAFVGAMGRLGWRWMGDRCMYQNDRHRWCCSRRSGR